MLLNLVLKKYLLLTKTIFACACFTQLAWLIRLAYTSTCLYNFSLGLYDNLMHNIFQTLVLLKSILPMFPMNERSFRFFFLGTDRWITAQRRLISYSHRTHCSSPWVTAFKIFKFLTQILYCTAVAKFSPIVSFYFLNWNAANVMHEDIYIYIYIYCLNLHLLLPWKDFLKIATDQLSCLKYKDSLVKIPFKNTNIKVSKRVKVKRELTGPRAPLLVCEDGHVGYDAWSDSWPWKRV